MSNKNKRSHSKDKSSFVIEGKEESSESLKFKEWEPNVQLE